ncbi:MAG TPA: MMPL family transporter [Acidimicrobiia bacterium]|nr:MMPL family transporter [Acidimicrobiia bacterium]
MLERLARTMYRRRKTVLAVWIFALIGVFALSGAVGGAFKTEFKLPGTESQEAYDLLAQSKDFRDRQIQAQIVFKADQGVDDADVQAAMDDFFAKVDEIPNVSVVSPYSDEGASQISQNGEIAYAQLNMADRSAEGLKEVADQVVALGDKVDVQGLEIEYGGNMFAKEALNGKSEAIGLIAAIIILLFAFGSVLAMGLPIGTALFGIGTGIAIVSIANNFVDMPDFTTAATAMIGLGVGIDYALFIVTRYRENLEGGLDPERSVVRALDTAGRAVLFAGTTVVISILGLLLMQTSIYQGSAIGIAIGVLTTMLASVTLLPALLGFVGRNIDKFGIHRRKARANTRESVWVRWSHVIQRRPWPALIVGLVILLVLAVPMLSMRFGLADSGNRPESDTTRRAYDLVAEGFGPGFNGPLLLVAETPDGEQDLAALTDLSEQLSNAEGVAFATPPISSQDGSIAVMRVFPTSDPQSESTAELVDRLRDDVIPSVIGNEVDVKVGGLTASADDFSAYTAERIPIFMGAVLLLSFLLLMLVFRSLLVPLKAVIMNLLSIGAAFGVVVAVFQWGWAADLIGVDRATPIEAWAPVYIFAIVFGLSMDYEVFLLSRIKEEYDRTGHNATAVADGLALTARVITAAAAIMVCVFGSFVLGDEVALKLLGLGLAVAVLIDATVVRLVLVPSTMELLGDWNWWLPKWLDRILPRVHVEANRSLEEELADLAAEDEKQPTS